MYSTIDIFSKVKIKAEKFTMENDRFLYTKFFETAEEFCIKNNILMGGRVGLDLIVGQPLTKDSYVWSLYCDDTFATAKKLSESLGDVSEPHISSKTVALITNIKHKEFQIHVNGRVLFKIYSLDRYRGLKLVDLMGPVLQNGYFTNKKIKLLSEEIQLIEVYRILYSPKKIALWQENIKMESTLFNTCIKHLRAKSTTEIYGAAELVDKDHIEQKIVQSVIKNSDNILIGDYAIKSMGISRKYVRLQFLSCCEIDELLKKIGNCIQNKNLRVSYVKYPLNIPSDFQIKKYTIYVNNGKDQIPIADVFNSPQYEMIPYWKGQEKLNQVKIANPWVLLRFLFIDIWVLKLILNIGTERSDFIKSRIVEIINTTINIKKIVDDLITSQPIKLFQLNDYVGDFIDDEIAKKKLIRNIGERYPVYYPFLHKIRGGYDAAGESKYKTSSINLKEFTDAKRKILYKITKKSRGILIEMLKEYYGSAASSTHWGVNRDVGGFYLKNATFLPYVPPVINTHLDLGCGDGLDVVAIKNKYQVTNSVCADINDNRNEKYKNQSSLLKITINQPMEIADSSVDFVTIFHVLHHCSDAVFRIKDISRVAAPGCVLLLKDHDVDCAETAANVDFEHFVYDVGEGKHSFGALFKYSEIEPMYYYSRSALDNCLCENGFIKIFNDLPRGVTKIYKSVYKKISME